MTELGKIEPERITEEEYQRRMAEASGEEAAAVASEKIRISKILHFIPGVLLIACLCLAGADKEHAIGYLIASCIILGVFYGTQVVRAAKIARAGSNIMAKKALLTSFIPLLASLNIALQGIIANPTSSRILSSLSEGLETTKTLITTYIPEYGIYIYYLFIGIILIGINLLIIRAFRKVLKGLKLAGKAAEVLTK